MPIGRLYATYHLLREPGNTIDKGGLLTLNPYRISISNQVPTPTLTTVVFSFLLFEDVAIWLR